jgi:CHAP domain-containing protein
LTSSSSKLLAAARADLGTRGRPNHITRDYASRHGDAFLRAAWCNMAVTYWARKSGTADLILPKGDRAYTPWHAQDFMNIGQWKAGTAQNILKYAKPGFPVFFDWGQTDNISAIDHIGLIEAVLSDGRIQTIEANTGDACLRRIRGASVIAGFGVVKFDTTEGITEGDPMLGLKKGDKGKDVEFLQEMLVAAGFEKDLGKAGIDGEYGDATTKAVYNLRKSQGSTIKPDEGDNITPRALRQIYVAVMKKS